MASGRRMRSASSCSPVPAIRHSLQGATSPSWPRGRDTWTCSTTLPVGQQITWNIEHFPKPVVARINGIALGGGTELALCCDIRVAADTAIMGVPEINLGIIPGYGGTQRLPRIVGVGMAKKLVLTGEHIKAEEAYRIGLVDMIVPEADLDDAVAKLCKRIATKSPVALAMGKEAINMGLQADLRTGLSIEARCFCMCFGSEDREEGHERLSGEAQTGIQGPVKISRGDEMKEVVHCGRRPDADRPDGRRPFRLPPGRAGRHGPEGTP